MAGLKQLKRVSWAPDVKLCQVRLFLSDDAPSLSGLGTQDTLQAKTSWMVHASGMDVDDSLPPGFESPHPSYRIGVDISKIPVVKWKKPCKILLNPELHVVAGEESEEVSVQLKRELNILEHFYPVPSSIPPNPYTPPEVQDSKFDDTRTPRIPVLPIEDEDASDQSQVPVLVSASAQVQQPNPQHIESRIGTRHAPDLGHLQENAARPSSSVSSVVTSTAGVLQGAEPDVVAAASAAYTAILRSNEEGSMIDRELLINILKNPNLVEKLLAEHGTTKPLHPPSTMLPVRPSPDQSISSPAPPRPLHINVSSLQQASLARPPPAYNLPEVVPPLVVNSQPSPAIQVAGTTPVKDINYYKSLIQQHGGDTQTIGPNSCVGNYHSFGNGVDVSKGLKHQTEMKSRIQKPCAFFNTPRGCRHGASCLFLHDASVASQVEHSKGSKRIKLDGGIGGRN